MIPRKLQKEPLTLDFKPWVIAHRGACDEAPENTRSAFARALTYPIDGIELDVQLSADGHMVLYHDWTLRRVARWNRRISDVSLAELTPLDWGAWFDPAFAGEPLPLLEPILEEMGPRTRWFVEIKAHPAEKKSSRARRLTDQVLLLLDTLEERTSQDMLHVLCFDAELLAYAAGLRPNRRYILNLSSKEAKGIMKRRAATDHLWGVDVPIARLSAGLVKWARRCGLRIFTYTCNRAHQITKATAFGVDGVITDRPGWLTRLWDRSPAQVQERCPP
jgi:glycerophosphoryl diester phosphodiesterase